VLLNTSFNLAGEPIVNSVVEGYSRLSNPTPRATYESLRYQMPH